MKLTKEDLQAIASEVQRLQDAEPKQPASAIKTGASAQKSSGAQNVGSPKGAKSQQPTTTKIAGYVAKWGLFIIYIVGFGIVLAKLTPYIFN